MKENQDYKVMLGFIGRMKETEKLYQLEQKLSDIIYAIADERTKLFKLKKSEYWTKAITTTLFDILNQWDNNCSKRAAKVFLEQFEK